MNKIKILCLVIFFIVLTCIPVFGEEDDDIEEFSFIQEYAKPMIINPQDLSLSKVIAINSTTPNDTKIVRGKYGYLEIKENHLIYTPNTMEWDNYDSFYVLGNKYGKKILIKIILIPSNNIYYEDDFITNDKQQGINYESDGSGKWLIEGEKENLYTYPEKDGVYGWIPSLSTQEKDTDNSIHHGIVKSEMGSRADASFNFTGMGVDIYSRTSGDSGTVIAILYNKDMSFGLGKIVDTLSESGTYYQVPTLSFLTTPNGDMLPYDTYTVDLYVTAAAKGRLNYYLDGIRVYNPLGNDEEKEEYYIDEEKNAIFTNVRKHIIDISSYTVDGINQGVFLDKNDYGEVGFENSHEVTIGEFIKNGPKNEIYLKPGQAISFCVNSQEDNYYQVGLKSINGVQTVVKKSNGHKLKNVVINHSSDLYYKVIPNKKGIIYIANNSPKQSNALLSITNLKVTNEDEQLTQKDIFSDIKTSELIHSAKELEEEEEKEEIDIQENIEIDSQEENISKYIDLIFANIYQWFK